MPQFIRAQISKSVKNPCKEFSAGQKAHRIEQYAIKRGWFARMSVTQAQWTSKGIYDAGLWNPIYHGTYRPGRA